MVAPIAHGYFCWAYDCVMREAAASLDGAFTPSSGYPMTVSRSLFSSWMFRCCLSGQERLPVAKASGCPAARLCRLKMTLVHEEFPHGCSYSRPSS